MISVILAVFTIIIGLSYYHLNKKLRYFEDRGVPYSPGWPLFGNMTATVFRRQHMSDTIMQIYNEHKEAKYVGAFEFTKPIVVLRDPEVIKLVAIKNFDSFPGHQSFVDETIDPMFACNLFVINGEYWKEMRNLLSPTFTNSRMKLMHESITRCAKNCVDRLMAMSDDQRRMVVTKDLFKKYTGDAIVSSLYGVDIDTLKDPDHFFHTLGRRGTNFDGTFTIKLMIARYYPKLIKWLRLKFIPEDVIEAFQNFLDETVKTRDAKGISNPDMIQLMMDARNKFNYKHLKLDLTEMTSQAFTFFFGGYDTTSTQLCIVAHEIALNADVQEKLQDEIDEIMAETNGNPTYDDVLRMSYVEAVFSESLRRHSQASILDRICVKDFELPAALPGGKPFVVKAGTNIWIPVVGVHMDPTIFEDPKKFDPNRFYGTKVNANDCVNLGFGVGPRTCIGNRFTILEAKILLVHLLSRFHLRPNEKTSNPLRYDKSTYTIAAEGGFWLNFELRDK